MPICKRDGFDLNNTESKNETFHDNDLVFCCYITKRIFRDYDHYFRHVMAINSTVWQCEATGKDGLTFEEALKSERTARKKLEQFKQSLRAPVMLVIEHARQSAVKMLNLIVNKFLRKRFFLNEEVTVNQKKNTIYTVVGITPGKGMQEPNTGVYEDTDKLEYVLRAPNGTEMTVSFDQLRRQRTEFNMENLSMFIKNSVIRVDGILRPKPELYKQYVTEPKLSFSTIFIGKMPRYSPAKIKRPEPKEAKKQSTLNQYIVKGEESIAKKKESAEARAKSLADEMERMRVEKQNKIAELELVKAQKKAELILRVEEETRYLTTKTDDLERNDQRMLPTYQPIVTFLPEIILGDAFVLREFMHTYSGLLSGVEVFRQNLNFYEMSRAFSAREVAGPLSDILLVLLGTIFDLQKEEEDECPVKYLLRYGNAVGEPYDSMKNASRTQFYVKRHFSFKLHEMPMDALTLSEVLRLHLLASGAVISDKPEKWRVMYRNGYSSREDPGLQLRLEHPHILHALRTTPIAQLDFVDICRVVNCLMAQILTYSATINIVEERMEKTAKAKVDLRALMMAENRRLTAVEANKRKLTSEHHQQCMNKELKLDSGQKEELGEQLNRRIAELMAQSEREQRKHEQQVMKLQSELFNFLVFLGMDRCYRKYYVLESMPGIFVEHTADNLIDTCLEQPPLNISAEELRKRALMPKQRKDLRFYLLKLYGDGDKKSRKSNKQSLENKENQENRLNGHAPSTEPIDISGEDEEQSPPTQSELLMCSGDSSNCLVHNQTHAQRRMWTYLYKPEDIDALIKSLNPLGWRESELLDELSQLRTLILEHVKNCAEDMLNLDTDKKREKFVHTMHTETNRKYNQANFGLPDDTNLNEVMRLHLVDRILQFEHDIFSGDLGKLSVKDMEKWRQQLLKDEYDPQCKLQWGPRKAHSEEPADSDQESHEDFDDQEDETDEAAVLRELGRKYGSYRDPGQYVNGSDVPAISESTSKSHQTQVRNMASALLQVEQAIGRRFMKEPFGVNMKRDGKQENLKLICEARLQQWEVSLMESTSYAQVFLHLNVLNDCILWRRSTNKSLCKVCRRGTDPEKMLLCDQCNGGTHMFCMKPKMRTVPEGNWYCHTCVRELGLTNNTKASNKQQKKRKFIVDEVDDDVDEGVDDGDDDNDEDEGEEEADVSDRHSEASSTAISVKVNGKAPTATRRSSRRSGRRLKSKEIEEVMEEEASEQADDSSMEVDEDDENDNNEEEDTEEDKACQECFYDGCEICCARCSEWYHLECVKLKRQPRNDFVCKKCKSHENTRARRRPSHVDGDADDDEEEPQAKRSRSSRNSLRISLDKSATNNNNNNNNNNNTSNQNNNRRSGRRTNDNLPLNSAALYSLLEQTMKHQAAWPFLRPVMSSEVPDYHKIIKTPMDLAKIKSKLNMGEYQLNEELLSDIQLVFKNCDLYNVRGNEIYDAGSKLERFVMDRCKDMMLPFRPSDMNVDAIC
ncbi:bromodomain adjacent to zinc finger domain protein 1A [Drosophila nasuta]|uniref:bromodomain adjacent to zinc finger domain protein 1A n=1 Tax=Drosophila nasuta TaxID=42062 RepID=UPI00295EFD0F|nr:bromodomain adjacent to zinc finger domain protein 1A [Drosophila nasuta]